MTKKLMILVFGALVALAACATDEPEGRPTDGACTVDEDCQAGRYCGAGNECTSDCDPSSASTTCPEGQSCSTRGRCVSNGECTVDSDCNAPPETQTCDGDVLVGFSESGQCVQEDDGTTFCDYAETRNTCENGCSAGSCNADPCDSVACTTPPPAVCDGDTRVSFTSNGTCSGDGECTYPENREVCAAGCTNGVCNDAACENTVCDDPPPNRCDGETVVTYAPNGTCDDSGGAAVCDYAPMFETCTYTGATCDSATCINPIQQVGGVVIVEYMADPVGSSTDENEWFEIINVSGAAIDLTDWKIRSEGAAQVHTIADNVQTAVPTFADGERLVFAREATAVGMESVDYVYSDVFLANGGDWIQLENAAGDIVDYVYYEPGTPMDGRSRKFNPALSATAASNDVFGNWCPSLDEGDAYTTAPANYGTPGQGNTQCTVDPCAQWTCERPDDFCLSSDTAYQHDLNDAMCESTRFNNPYCDYMGAQVGCQASELCAAGVCEPIPNDLPGVGDVIFTEFMANPTEVNDSEGEWFEIHNTSSSAVSLFSVVIADGANDNFTVLDPNLNLPAGEYLAFVRNSDDSANGGIQGAVEYACTPQTEFSHGCSTGNLVNSPSGSTALLRLELQDGTVVSEPYYGPVGGASSMPAGAAIQLDPASLTATDAEDVANWCEATSVYGDGDLGTPGAANDTCN